MPTPYLGLVAHNRSPAPPLASMPNQRDGRLDRLSPSNKAALGGGVRHLHRNTPTMWGIESLGGGLQPSRLGTSTLMPHPERWGRDAAYRHRDQSRKTPTAGDPKLGSSARRPETLPSGDPASGLGSGRRAPAAASVIMRPQGLGGTVFYSFDRQKQCPKSSIRQRNCLGCGGAGAGSGKGCQKSSAFRSL